MRKKGSAKSSEKAYAIVEGALYQQTAMTAEFPLLGFPTIQVSQKKPLSDVLVSRGLRPSVTSGEEFSQVLQQKQERVDPAKIYEAIGVNLRGQKILAGAFINRSLPSESAASR